MSDVWKPEVLPWALAQAGYLILLIAMICYAVVFGPALWQMGSEMVGEFHWFTIEDIARLKGIL